jgi:hypothetical protein
MVQNVFQMDKEEFTQLNKMHHQIGQSGISAFDTAYLERYTELLAKSLKGKSDTRPTPRA